MRQITTHQVEGEKYPIDIEVLDEPNQKSGANHRYSLEVRDEQGRPVVSSYIGFQYGPVEEEGCNGISNEALLAVVIDRLEGFQKGSFPCEENEHVLKVLFVALSGLMARTLKRLARGVEGKNEE